MKDYEAIIRKLIHDGNEAPKVDFKSSASLGKSNIVQLARIALAMANTDSEDLDDIGFIILGAAPGKLVGGIDELATDSVRAGLPTRLNRYITPPARIEVRAYEDNKAGWFGAVLVRPSRAMRPHFVAKEYSDSSAKGPPLARKNECYVRRGESVGLASREDFDRMYQERFEFQLRGYEEREQNLPSPVVEWVVAEEGVTAVKVPPSKHLSLFVPNKPAIGRAAFVDSEIDELETEAANQARKYNKGLVEFDREWDAATDKIAHYNRAASCLNALRLRCLNAGRAPLHGANVFLYFPEGFRLVESPPSEPSAPQPPRVPRFATNRGTVADLLGGNATWLQGVENYSRGSALDQFSLPVMRTTPPTFGGMSVKDERTAQGWFDKLSHGDFYVAFRSPVYLLPPETEGTYAVRYEVYGDELPDPVTGELTINVAAGVEVMGGFS